LDPVQIMELVGIGLAAGVVGGMLGVGGSIVMIPAMTEVLGPDQHLYQAAAMIVNFFVVTPAVYQHNKAKAGDRAMVFRLVPLALLSVLAGVGLSELSIFSGRGEANLRAGFGLFLLVLCVVDLIRLFGRRPEGDENASSVRPTWRFAALVSVPTGLVAGLFGVGGGVLAVPLQRRFLGVPIRNAIANSAAIIIATSLVGATAKNYAYIVENAGSCRPLLLAATLAPTAMIGSLFGSRLTHVVPVKTVKVAFFVLLSIAAMRMIYGAVTGIGGADV